MAQAKQGDTVNVHYTGTLEDGTVFDTSVECEPLQFTIDEGQVIPGFEQAVVGMNPGESKTVRILSDEAYSPYRKEMVLVVDRDRFPEGFKPEVGQRLQISREDGLIFIVAVVDIAESNVTLDANYPLSGKDLVFDIKLVGVA